MNEEQFEALLFEEESPTLDFKREQYRFAKEPDDVKGELLKDVLAFANSWRRTDAYILVGVEEVKGGKSKVVGVPGHLDDADLQQFINSKTQRTVEFSYSAFKYHQSQVSVIRIPVQVRPLFLKSDYGRLRRGVVYVRRGSSTAEADPDEIAKMGAAGPLASESPKLKLEFAAVNERTVLGTTTNTRSVLLSLPESDEIPDYCVDLGPLSVSTYTNRHYYRERAAYWGELSRVEPLRFAVTNEGGAPANDIRLEAFVAGVNLFVQDERDLPRRPVRDSLNHRFDDLYRREHDVHVYENGDGWRIVADFGKCQAKQTIFTLREIFLGASSSCDITIHAKLFADELPNPTEFELVAKVSAETRVLTPEAVTNR